jgi:asparagine synthase (glutamine-hydrolysing)
MCGITGIFRFDGRPVTPTAIRAMMAQLTHRGPDDDGLWCEGSVGLGHRRLSIIDIAGSPQPMSSVNGSCRVCYNGEIFNYRALREGLPYPYKTGGDTEVLLSSYLAHGPEAVGMLRGQFAYALFDARERELWLFRDRLGVLPLYYYVDAKMFAFASEVKALLPVLSQSAEVDHDSLDAYLTHRAVPSPYTLFRNIRKLPPAHLMRVRERGAETPRRYWQLPPAGEVRSIGKKQAVAEVGGALRDAVAGALVADVPVGAYLSGGVDSSLIVAIMKSLRDGGSIETFSAGFPGSPQDESAHAQRVSELIGTTHHRVVVEPSDFLQLWPRLTWHRDAPISEPADVAVFRLAEAARARVKVVLSGEGSDELFGGYPKHRFAAASRALDFAPPFLRGGVAGLCGRMLPANANRLRIALRAAAAASESERLNTWFAPFSTTERLRLLGACGRDVETEPGLGDPLRRMLEHDIASWLPDNLLERGDRMSMAASIELRPPFLDYQLVELAFSLPSSLKAGLRTTKWVVKEVARKYLPHDLVDRRKVGFRVPLENWFRGELRSLAWDMLDSSSSFVAQTMDRDTIRSLLQKHEAGRGNEEMRIWTLLCLEVWHSVFFGDGGFSAVQPAREGPSASTLASKIVSLPHAHSL